VITSSNNTYERLQKRRHIRIGVPIECCVASVYTRAMFDMFSNELYASRSLIVDEKDQTSVFHVSKASIQGGTQSTPVWIVKSYTDLDVPRMECTCGQFEHMAMPCRHILKVPSFRIMHDCNSIMLHFVVLSVTITTLIV
jgi:hypothetical protein